jgi:hypothetical protein
VRHDPPRSARCRWAQLPRQVIEVHTTAGVIYIYYYRQRDIIRISCTMTPPSISVNIHIYAHE